VRLASPGGIKFSERQAFRFFRLRKRIKQFLRFKSGMDKTVVFIIGCQRSGTSMLHHLFRLDWNVVTYDEASPLSYGTDGKITRYIPLPEVKARIQADRSPLVVAKPLVESQDILPLLDLFPDTKAVWMFRHYADVASSNLKYFSTDTGFKDLIPILARDQVNWRSRNMAESDTRAIEAVYSESMDPHDAAALFWYARNSLYFSCGYDDDSRIALCRYGDLVTEPGQVMRQAYQFVGHPYPGDRIVADVFSGSKGKGKDVPLSDAILKMCEALWERLNAAAEHQEHFS
jgi:hypothetical protein